MKHGKAILFFVLVIALAALAGWFSVAGFNKKSGTEVCFKQNCYKVELALTPAQQEQGLMFRKSLDKDKGMFFEFDRDGIYPFWMKNTLMPLDIVWIGPDKKIVFISADTRPCVNDHCVSIDPGKDARYVLEINAGETVRINAKVGDEVSF
jgi:uncharacterized protein